MVAPGAMPSQRILGILGVMAFPAPEITDIAQATAVARRLLEAGVDGIKVHLQPPPAPHPRFPRGAIEAVVKEAHRSMRGGAPAASSVAWISRQRSMCSCLTMRMRTAI